MAKQKDEKEKKKQVLKGPKGIQKKKPVEYAI